MQRDAETEWRAGDGSLERVERALLDAAAYEAPGAPPVDLVERARLEMRARAGARRCWSVRVLAATGAAALCVLFVQGGGDRPSAPGAGGSGAPGSPKPVAVAPALTGPGDDDRKARLVAPTNTRRRVQRVASGSVEGVAARRRVAVGRPPRLARTASRPVRSPRAQWVHETVQRPPSGVLAPVVVVEQDPESGGVRARPGVLQVRLAGDDGTDSGLRFRLVDSADEEE